MTTLEELELTLQKDNDEQWGHIEKTNGIEYRTMELEKTI